MATYTAIDADRKAYLDRIADDYGVPRKVVYMAAYILGKDADRDGLISHVAEISDMYL